jgi:tetratricopeptide (TPR) repeat protein
MKQKSLISFAILFFAITFSVQSNLLLNIGTFMNERFMFVSLIGFCIMVALIFRWLSGEGQTSRNAFAQPALYIFVFIITAFSAMTFARNFAWKDSETLFLTDVKTSVNSARCNYIAGFTLLEKARREPDAIKQKNLYLESAMYLERGLNIYEMNTSALGNLGEVYIALKKYDAAITMYMKLLELIPDDQVSFANLRVIANLYVKENNFTEAIHLLKILADKTVIDPADYNTIGEIFGRSMNQLDSAEAYFEMSLKRYQNYAPALENMGLVQGLRGNYAKSLEYLLKAYPLDSTNVGLLKNMSHTYNQLGNQQKAVEMLNKANSLGPQ